MILMTLLIYYKFEIKNLESFDRLKNDLNFNQIHQLQFVDEFV